jgi:hypothetical protein
MLYIALGIFGAVASLIIFLVIAGGLFSENQGAIAVTATTAISFTAALLLLSAISIIGGVGLLRRRSWARPLVIFLAVLSLFNFPLGTVVGIYALWTLLKPEARVILAPRPGVWAHLH